MNHARSSFVRRLVAFVLGAVPAVTLGCSSASPPANEETGRAEGAIVDVEQTPVERQAIGNCWIYAEASWVESLHKARTGEDFDISQSYWTYWHWFDQIVGSSRRSISTGGSWSTANRIVQRYGLVAEKDFLLADTTREMSEAQGSAEAFIDEALAEGGALGDPATRKDRAAVRRVLDAAWGLDRPENAAAKAALDTAFGPAVERTLQGRTATTRASFAGTPFVEATDFAVTYAVRSRSGEVTRAERTFADAMREWRSLSYPSSAKQRRTFQKSVQRALHARQPVVLSWAVDFNALEGSDPLRKGSFNMTTLRASYAVPSESGGGPGRQGGHMVVLEDYQVRTTAFGVLAAGVTLDPALEVDQAKLTAALADDSVVELFRIKNSWGANRVGRAFVPGFPGYHDLAMDYLEGPIQWCSDPEDTDTDVDRGCSYDSWRSVPLNEVVLPPGF